MHQQAEESCAFKLQRIMAEISRGFLESSDFDSSLKVALKRMGEATGSDRCYLFLLSENSTLMSQTHEWCAPDVTPQKDFQQNLPVSESPWWMEQLRDRGLIRVKSLDEIPEEAVLERNNLAEKGIRSFAVAGIWGISGLKGFVGFDNCRHSDSWVEADIQVLRLFADIIASALQRRDADEAFRRSRDFNIAIIEATPDPLYRYTPDWKITFANDAYCKYYGENRENILGKPFTHHVPENFEEELRKRIESISVANPVVVGEEPVLLRSGELRWNQWVDKGIFDNKGKLLEIQAIGRDITALKKAEQDIERSRQRLKSILSDTDALICRFDMNGLLTYVNETYCDFFGVQEKDLLGHDFFGFIPEDQREKVRNTFLSLTPERQSISYEHQVFRADKVLCWQRWTDRALFDESSRLIEYQSVGIDITDQVLSRTQAERALAQMERTFESTIAAMARIVETRDPYTAGHQKRTAVLARRIAMEMKLGENQIQAVYLGSLLHDIGKIQVPSEILSKPGALSRIEFSLIKSHPEAGAEILREISLPWSLWRMAVQHHERLDGSGYPGGLAGSDLGIEPRILAVADVVEAMVSHRPYRPALSLDQALAEIEQNSGILYDAMVVKVCSSLFRNQEFSFESEEAVADGRNSV